MIALVIDTETDGLVANHILALDKLPSVIEYCGLLVNLKTSKLLNEFTALVRPVEYPMTAKTIEDSKTKLNNGMLEAAPRFQSVSDTIRKQIETAPVVIAHNLSFDKEIIDTAFE